MRHERSWYRWHRSSLLLTITTVLIFALVVIPSISHAPDQRHASRYAYFGWPYIHRVVYERNPVADFSTADSMEDALRDQLLRDSVNGSHVLIPATSPGDLYSAFGGFQRTHVWSDRRNWAYVRPNSVGQFLWCGLAVNAFIAIGTSFAVGGLFELRCRRRNRILQMTVFDLLATFVAIGCVLGASQNGRRQQLNDEQLVNGISRDFPEIVDGYIFGTGGRSLSIWMTRLTDNRIFELDLFLNDRGLPSITQSFGRPIPVRSLNLQGADGLGDSPIKFDPQPLAQRVNTLLELDTIQLFNFDDAQLDILNHLNPDHINTISVFSLGKSQNLAALSRFTRLRKLELFRVDLERQDFAIPSLERLEELSISHEYAGENALTWLANLPQLKVLYLQTSFPNQNINEIRRRLPGVHVTQECQYLGGVSAF